MAALSSRGFHRAALLYTFFGLLFAHEPTFASHGGLYSLAYKAVRPTQTSAVRPFPTSYHPWSPLLNASTPSLS